MRCHGRFMITRRLPTPAGQHRSARTPSVLAGGALLLAGLCLISGCVSGIEATFAPYVEHKRRAIITLRAQAEAKQIWEACYESQHSESTAADAKHGFMTGYTETALGFVNSPPPVPARPCLSVHTLAHTYPNAGAWYSGYHQGAAAALAKGVDQWRLAPIDPGLLYPKCGTEILNHSGSNHSGSNHPALNPPSNQPFEQSFAHPLSQPLEEPSDRPSGKPSDEPTSQPSDEPSKRRLQSPADAMIDQDQYRDQEKATESPSDLPSPKVPGAPPEQDKEIIMKPRKTELIKN